MSGNLRLRATFSFEEKELKIIKDKMLNWADRFGIFLFLDSNGYTAQGGQYDCLLGAGAAAVFTPAATDFFDELFAFHQQHKDWLFGHLAYDLKNVLEPGLSSRHASRHTFPLLQFFVPEIVAGIVTGTATLFIEAADPLSVYHAIMDTVIPDAPLPALTFKQRMDQQTYLQVIEKLRQHIYNGDCYEINFCSEGYCNDVVIDPVAAFQKLNRQSPAPFAACYKTPDSQYLMCASPERYLSKTDMQVISQPIKGTARRAAGAAEDKALIDALYNSEKERAENVMIVDLVRNDLARSCKPGSVDVSELFGIYSFPHVHQMISSVTGILNPGIAFTTALKYSFPVGSMTGAPKVKVMELIEQYEVARRTLFAGSVGYITPDGDFDFNVVIRSLFYNAASAYLSYQTGGAITWDSDPQAEWDEMRLKAGGLEKVFS